MITRARFLLLLVGSMALAGSMGLTGYPAQGAAYTVGVATGVVEGHAERILTDAHGFAVYYLTSDTPASSSCTGSCAKLWPPISSAVTPTAPSSLKGGLAVVHTANGSQVSYNGRLLYRYAADAKPGQVNGNDLEGPRGGEWYVATPTLAVSHQTTQTSGGYSGYR